MSTPDFDANYRRVMDLVWSHPRNDQRPAVREFLETFEIPGDVVVDIGAGDAYYLDLVMPSMFVVVEPNSDFKAAAVQKARTHGMNCVSFETVGELLATDWPDRATSVLLLHSLLYLTEVEANALLLKIRSLPLLVAHPIPRLSTTAAFATMLGDEADAALVALKSHCLPSPVCRSQMSTHLFVPGATPMEDLAFLVSHRQLLRGYPVQDTLSRARDFCESRLADWRRGDSIAIPQAQVLEAYNCHRRDSPHVFGLPA